LGSATLALAYVAAGWLDGYFNLALKPWDTAAGILIVAEAGGRCSTLEGEPYRVDLPGCLATNGRIHGELLGVMRGT
jgi:myo-inositol-1(or 4)-monophosphatase